ncbi:hypothetical protein [Streptomyces sp. SID12501]|uniref:DUF732 domain-containing protein n=1 Tax=Streptomyces sp. SID12501 TaxID=2706042 RepID=A0A6B3C704_9ACTN|nr:hypothetical protein [Streptomyces sp. SID12501]NEC92194.1 hypothetical protein [Streptomyces sp. SID12501]
MRHTAAALLTATLLATLTACGTSSSGDDKPAAKPSPTPTVSKKDQYLKAARDITFNGAPTDTELLVFPMLWCQELESGHSVEWMFDITGGGGLYPVGETWGTKKADANSLLVAGVKAYCPENLDAVQEELRASGEY